MDEGERPTTIIDIADRRWLKVYAAVLVFTVFIIAALWAFSRFFSDAS